MAATMPATSLPLPAGVVGIPRRLNAPLLVWKDMVTIAIEACIVLQGLAVGQVLARMFFLNSGI